MLVLAWTEANASRKDNYFIGNANKMLTILFDKRAIIPNTVVLMWSVRALSVYASSRCQLPPGISSGGFSAASKQSPSSARCAASRRNTAALCAVSANGPDTSGFCDCSDNSFYFLILYLHHFQLN